MAGRGPPRLIRSPPMNAPDAEGAGLGGSENQTFPLEHIEVVPFWWTDGPPGLGSLRLTRFGGHSDGHPVSWSQLTWLVFFALCPIPEVLFAGSAVPVSIETVVIRADHC